MYYGHTSDGEVASKRERIYLELKTNAVRLRYIEQLDKPLPDTVDLLDVVLARQVDVARQGADRRERDAACRGLHADLGLDVREVGRDVGGVVDLGGVEVRQGGELGDEGG